MHVVQPLSTARKQIYNFLKNVNIINVISSFSCEIKDANANVSQEDLTMVCRVYLTMILMK